MDSLAIRSTSRARSALICSLTVSPVSALQPLQGSGAAAAALTNAQAARPNNSNVNALIMVLCIAASRRIIQLRIEKIENYYHCWFRRSAIRPSWLLWNQTFTKFCQHAAVAFSIYGWHASNLDDIRRDRGPARLQRSPGPGTCGDTVA